MTSPVRWPQPRQYRAAVQLPRVCFADPRLKRAVIQGNGGIPLAMGGRYAIVFKATTDASDIAIRCFTRAAGDQGERYRALQAHLPDPLPPYLVRFAYWDQQILVGPGRYPLVEMDWVEGEPLDVWVGNHLGGTHLLDQAAAWLHIVNDMRNLKLAHGDIANDNCLVSGSQLKLIDYDGCFIPRLAGKNPSESGIQHFQHPDRPGYYAENMDAFPALVVLVSLLALHGDPSLWGRFHTDRNLIFHDKDFEEPGRSDVWTALASSRDDRVGRLAAALATMCESRIDTLPSLREVTAEAGFQVTTEPPWKLVPRKAAETPWWMTSGRTLEPRTRPRPTWPAPASNKVTSDNATPDTAADSAVADPSYSWVEDHLWDRPPSRQRPSRADWAQPPQPQPPQPLQPPPARQPPTPAPQPQTPQPRTPQPRTPQPPTPTSRPRTPPARPPARPARPPVTRAPRRPAARKRHPVRTAVLTVLVVLLVLFVLLIVAGLLNQS